jgi:hypothetical protein
MRKDKIEAIASAMPGTPAWTVAVFRADDVPVGTVVAPVQAQEPVATFDMEVIDSFISRITGSFGAAMDSAYCPSSEAFKTARQRFYSASEELRNILCLSASRAPVQPVVVPDSMSNKVRAFIDSVIEIGFEADDVDGAAILQWAEDAGLIEARTMTEPCSEGQNCRCATDNDFPLTCYQKTYRRAAPAAQGDAKDAEMIASKIADELQMVNDDSDMRIMNRKELISIIYAAIAAKGNL